jgi:hypothetical protein
MSDDEDNDDISVESVDEVAALAESKLEAFTRALNRCSIVNIVVINAIVNVQGVNSIDIFASLSLKNIESLAYNINKTPRKDAQANSVVSVVALSRLLGLREWIKWREASGLSIDPDLFDNEWMKLTMKRMEREAALAIGDKTSSPTPMNLKSTGSNYWSPFWKQFQAYCLATRGSLMIPIAYVFREASVEVNHDITAREFFKSDQSLMDVVSLKGEHFDIDNTKVWELLVPLINTGSAWPFIKNFEKTQDGRAAILRLKGQSEGDASMSSRKTVAYGLLNTVRFTGKSNKFTFDNYIEKLQFSFTELEEVGQPLYESKKVDILVNNIDYPLLIPNCDLILDDEIKKESFKASVEYLQSILSRRTGSTGSIERRGVSSTTSSTSGGGLKMSYTSEEWSNLPQSTKDKVIAKRLADKKKTKKLKSAPTASATSTSNADPTTTKGWKRKVNVLQTELAGFKTTGEDDDSDDTEATPTVKNSTVKSTKRIVKKS